MGGEDRDVKAGFGKKGMYTGGAKSGFGNSTYGHLFSKPFEYMSDPYDNKRNQELVIIGKSITKPILERQRE